MGVGLVALGVVVAVATWHHSAVPPQATAPFGSPVTTDAVGDFPRLDGVAPGAPATDPIPSSLARGQIDQGRDTIAVTTAGDDALIAHRDGRVGRRTWADGSLVGAEALLLDLRDETRTDGEEGLLDVAVSPRTDELYVSITDRSAANLVLGYDLTPGHDVDTASRRTLLRVPTKHDRHFGGSLIVLPDGTLLVGLGDGGGEDDPDDAARQVDNLRGDLVVLDPAGRQEPTPVATGLRNPWRISHDTTADDLWIGDVGEERAEEVNRLGVDEVRAVLAGRRPAIDFGWSAWEGSRLDSAGRRRPGTRPPVVELLHSAGWCAIGGGFVYRGHDIPALRSAYVFADVCTGVVWALRASDDRVTAIGRVGVRLPGMVGFGETPDHEILLMSLSEGIWQLGPS